MDLMIGEYLETSKNSEIQITAVITKAFRGSFYVHTGKNSFRIHHGESFIPGEVVKIKGIIRNAA